MGQLVYAAAMSHVLYPDYYGKNVGPHGRAMVEELIGVPPGVYQTRRRRHVTIESSSFLWHWIDDGRTFWWSSNDGEITIRLSKDGRVTNKTFQDVSLESPQDTIWRWLGFPQPTGVILID